MFSQSPPKYLIIENERIINLEYVKQIINHSDNDDEILISFIDGTITSIKGYDFNTIRNSI